MTVHKAVSAYKLISILSTFTEIYNAFTKPVGANSEGLGFRIPKVDTDAR